MNQSKDYAGHFDSWAANYDRSVAHTANAGSYPFAGYDEVVAAAVELAGIEPSSRILDIGAGTGNRTTKLINLADEVWGTDFSDKMLAKAREKVPQARFVCWDMNDSWPSELPLQFHRIVSTYAMHHLEDKAKVSFLSTLAIQRLLPGGRLVVGDIAFPDEEAQAACRRNAGENWDDLEYYWVASRIVPCLERAGLRVQYKQISICGGVFVLQRTDMT